MPAEGCSDVSARASSDNTGRRSTFKAVIFAAGAIEDREAVLTEIESAEMLIAADSGADHCVALGVLPNVLIGDLDSIDPEMVRHFESRGVVIVRHPADKSATDLELAIDYAADAGSAHILIFGVVGGRWDHGLANLLLPAAPRFDQLRIQLSDGRTIAEWLRDRSSIVLTGAPGDIVSLIPLGGDAVGVTTFGLEYALRGETLHFGSTRGVSNVLVREQAGVSLESGRLLCVLDRSPRATTPD